MFLEIYAELRPGWRRPPPQSLSGKIVIISLRGTREQMGAGTAGAGPSGIREQRNPAMAGLTAQHLETYEVTMHA